MVLSGGGLGDVALLEEERPEGELSEFKAFCHFQLVLFLLHANG